MEETPDQPEIAQPEEPAETGQAAEPEAPAPTPAPETPAEEASPMPETPASEVPPAPEPQAAGTPPAPEPPAAPAAQVPPAPPLAPPAPAAAPPKKKSNKKWWFIGCGCLLILLLCAAVAIGSTLFGGLKLFESVTAPVAPIKAQIDALNGGNVEKAYNEFTTQSFKDATSLEDFKEMVENNPRIFKSSSSSFANVNIKNNQATVTGTITGTDGTVTKMKFTLVNENGTWKIAGFEQQ